jgi:hypothetical protein
MGCGFGGGSWFWGEMRAPRAGRLTVEGIAGDAEVFDFGE